MKKAKSCGKASQDLSFRKKKGRIICIDVQTNRQFSFINSPEREFTPSDMSIVFKDNYSVNSKFSGEFEQLTWEQVLGLFVDWLNSL